MKRESTPYKFHLLLHSADLLQERLRTELEPLGITPNQARVIKTLGRVENASQIELAHEFGITAASMSTMTGRLIRAGFIKVEKDPENAKRNLLNLTPKGISLLDDISDVWSGIDRYMAERIGEENLQALGELTLRLRNALGGKDPLSK